MKQPPRNDDYLLRGEAAVQNFTDEELADNLRDMSDTQLAALGRLAMSRLTDWLVGYEDQAVTDEVSAMSGLLNIRNIQAELAEVESHERPDYATAMGI